MSAHDLTSSNARGIVVPIQTPTVTSVAPNNGAQGGGEPVTITGTNFKKSAAPTVLFGATPATAVVVTSATTITCNTPAHGAGAVTVHVNNAAGGDGAGLQSTGGAAAFTYN